MLGFRTNRQAGKPISLMIWRAVVIAALALIALTTVLSTPLMSDALLGRLQVFPAISPAELAKVMSGPPTAIVILSAGRRSYAPEFGRESVDGLSLERIRYGAVLARKTGLPILVSGGLGRSGSPSLAALLADTLRQDYGIAPRWLEDNSTNTAENAIFSTQILKRQGIGRVILVTHAWHMERARAAFLANGMSVIAAPTAFYGLGRVNLPFDLFPSAAALRMSAYAIHENVGIVWYRLRYGY